MVEGIAPYRTPPTDSVRWSAPELLEGEIWSPLEGEIVGWDPTMDLSIRGEVQLEPQAVELATGLRLEEMALSVSWSCSTSRWRDAAELIGIDRSGLVQYSVRLPGERLDGEVDIRIAVVARPSGATGAGTARRPGSILASKRFCVALEGTVGLFPVEIVDFSRTRLPIRASWHLETSQDLEQMFLAGFRLQVNERDKELTAAIASRAPSEREQALLDDLEEGVLGILLESASMLQVELSEKSQWEPETIGHVLHAMLLRSDDLGSVPTVPAELAIWRAKVSSRVRQLGAGRSLG